MDVGSSEPLVVDYPIKMRSYSMPPRQIDEKDRPTEDDLARKSLGPRGEPNGEDTAKMTPQREKKTPKSGGFDGHTA
jgi:hypothetical protein